MLRLPPDIYRLLRLPTSQAGRRSGMPHVMGRGPSGIIQVCIRYCTEGVAKGQTHPHQRYSSPHPIRYSYCCKGVLTPHCFSSPSRMTCDGNLIGFLVLVLVSVLNQRLMEFHTAASTHDVGPGWTIGTPLVGRIILVLVLYSRTEVPRDEGRPTIYTPALI